MATSSGDLFGRHLDLRPLRGRRRGLVTCVFHKDRTPSLSVDLDAQLFCCHGCGVSGGFKRFAELVGDSVAQGGARPARRDALEEARCAVLAHERAAMARRDRCRPLSDAADWYRDTMRVVTEARRIATTAGATEFAWDLLDDAAHLETLAEAGLAEAAG